MKLGPALIMTSPPPLNTNHPEKKGSDKKMLTATRARQFGPRSLGYQ